MSVYKITPATSISNPGGIAFNSDSAGPDTLIIDLGAFLIGGTTGAVLNTATGAWTVTINGTLFGTN